MLLGRRPSNDLVQVRYFASSSLRACALRLPSLTSNSAFSSLKVSSSRTASALIMPRRTRSYTRRSKRASSRPAPATPASFARCAAGAGLRTRGLALVAMPLSSDEHAEGQVQAAEAGSERKIVPAVGQQQRRQTEQHEQCAEDCDDARRGGAGADERAAVQQQPGAGYGVQVACLPVHGGDDGACEQTRQQA